MLITLLAFLFILAFSITIHEFGHFLVAKLFRIPVEKFSIGYGPPLLRKQIGETDFRIAYFPLGGYVKIAGEDEGEITLKHTEQKNTQITLNTEKDAPETLKEDTAYNESRSTEGTMKKTPVQGFYDAPIYKRVLIVLAGPLFNIFSAVLVLILVIGAFGLLINPYMNIDVRPGSVADRTGLMHNDSIVSIAGKKVNNWDEFAEILTSKDGQDVVIGIMRKQAYIEKTLPISIDSLGIKPLVPPILGSLKVDGPAHKAGMKAGDRVLRIGNTEIQTWDQMVDTVRVSMNVPLHFVWQDNGEQRQALIKPAPVYDPVSLDTIGQIGAIMPLERRHLPLSDVFNVSLRRSGEIVWLTLKTLYQLIVGRISRRALGGPIAIARLSGESARWGFENLLGLLAIISINLGLVNLFPIPALDGGHIVISLIEAIRKKRFSRRTRLIIQQVGYAIILLLVVFVTFNDITR